MEEFLHIVDRWVIHFFSSFSLVVILFFLLDFLRKKTVWVPQSERVILVLSAMTLFAFATLRESYDVSNGQPLVKALTDYSSWLIGSGCSSWGIYRLLKRGRDGNL